MAAMKCPNCGGPAQVAPGQTTVACTFCGTSFSTAPPAPPLAPPAPPSPYGASPYGPPPPAWGPPPQRPIPQIVVVAPGQSYQAPMAAAASFVGMRLLFGLLPVVIILFVGGIIAFTSMRATRGVGNLGLGLGGWNGSTPLLCGGNDEMQLSGITASFSSGSALNVSGNCHVTCQGCTLRAPVVVAAGGNAQIDLVDCHLEGADAVVAGGNAQVRFAGNSTVVGKITQGGNASVTGAPTATAGSPAAAGTAPPRPKPTVTSGPSPAAPSHGPSKPR